MKRVLALQQNWDDPPGTLGEIMDEYGIAYDVVNVEEEPVPAIDGYDALIILGGPQNSNAEDRYPYLTHEKELLRYVVERDTPYMGICLGGQLLARTLGAPVTPHHTPEIGFSETLLTDEGKRDPLFHGLPCRQQVIHWHEDTFAIPDGAIKLATGDVTENQAFRFGRHAYGLQYHIELTPAMLDSWLWHPDNNKEIVKTLGLDAPGRIAQELSTRYPIYREHSRIMFENFLRISECI